MIGDRASIPFHVLVPSPFGTLVVVWRDTSQGPRVQRLLLPRRGAPTEETMRLLHGGSEAHSCPAMLEIQGQLIHFLEGEDIRFSLDILAMETCSEFHQRVLRAEHGIPRGKVSSYGRIAQHLGLPGAARAVGSALARNPFPLLIPCHRAVRSDGELGGYQGGLEMKRALLTMEGVAMSPAGKVLTDRLYY